MSDITKRNGAGLPAGNDQYDAFTAFSGMSEREVGQYMSFSHGEWLYGQDKRTLPMGTKLVANMPGLRYGWRRWRDNKPVDDLRRLVVERPPSQVEPRASLGDTDKSLWDTMNGRPVDPWQLTMTVEMIDGSGERYILSMQAVTHVPTMMALATTYGKEGRMRPGQLPLVELGASFFMHSDTKIGKVHTPVLKVVGWVDGETLEPVEDVGGSHEIPFDVSGTFPVKGLDGQPAKPPGDAEVKKPRAPRF
jgi:hypothetical protein